MSLRLCLLGDSHLAAMKTGWDQISSRHSGQLDVSYFGAQSALLRDLEVNGSVLAPTSDKLKERLIATSGGKSEIDVRDYDAFVIIALGFNFRWLTTNLLARFRTMAYATQANGSFYVSNGCLQQAAKGLLSQTLAIELVSKIKAAGGSEVVFLPQPLPSEQLLKWETEGAVFRTFAENGDGQRAYDLFRDAAAAIAKSENIEFIEQPEETRWRGFLTRSEYSIGSVCLTEKYDIPHPTEDFGHMNSTYGIKMWDKVIRTLSAH